MTNQQPPLIVNCPLCHAEFRMRPFTQPRQVRCPRCHNEVELNPPVSDSRTSTPEHEADLQEHDSETQDVLGFLEDLFFKMIIGVFRFILVKLPWELWSLLTTWFPTAMRSLKVTVLGILWLLLVFGPSALVSHSMILQSPLGTWVKQAPEIVQLFLWGYTGIALAGSVWGLYYVRRKRKKRA